MQYITAMVVPFELDSFTVYLHSPNGMAGLMLWLCKKTVSNLGKMVEITMGHIIP